MDCKCPRSGNPIVFHTKNKDMEKILHIIASTREHHSYSYRLGQEIIKKIADRATYYNLLERRLQPPFVSADQIVAFYKTPEDRNQQEQASLYYSDEVIGELQNFDTIVVSTPMYSMNIPASLKAWIDQVVRVYVTFSYDANQNKVGMLKDKKMYVAIASGRIHSTEHYKTDFIVDYFKAVFKWLGITDITFFRVEGTASKDMNDINFAELITNL